MVQEFIRLKFIESFKDYSEKYKATTLRQVVSNAIIEERQDPFEERRLFILKMLGYVPGKRGSQDNSSDIDQWVRNNVSRGQRGIIINDILRAKNENEIHSLLDRSYNLAFKNNKFSRLRS